MTKATSAMLRDGRPALPAKITSSISEPRIDVGLVSPITQRRASNRLDFPQPLGPTIAVKPRSIKSSVGSINDLNPESLSLVNLKRNAPPYACALFFREERIQRRFQRRPGHIAWLLGHAIDHQCRSSIDAVPLGSLLRDLVDSLCIRLIRHACIRLGLIHSRGERGDFYEPGVHVRRIVLRVPVFLIPEEHVNEVKIGIPSARAARQSLSCPVCRTIDRINAKYVIDLPGID